jgi:hypothetical protein
MMHSRLSQQQRVFIVEHYWQTRNAARVIDAWRDEFADPPPHRETIYNIRDRFHQTGTVADMKRTGRPTSVNTDVNAALVATSLQQSPCKSANRLSVELGIRRTSLQNILRKNGYRPYHPHLVHGLLEDDPDRRLQMCELFLSQFEEDDQLTKKIIWSDEAKFVLNGSINRHNCIYYETSNPCVTIETQLKQPGVTVWGAISTEGLIGPYFFDGTVNGTNYHDMLSNYVLPQLQQRPDYDSLIFMQDGAPPHYATVVRNLLDTLPGGWMGRRGPIEWALDHQILRQWIFSCGAL